MQSFSLLNEWTFLNILDPYLDKELIQNTLEVIFSLKDLQKKNQLKIPVFSKSDDAATWSPNSYRKMVNSEILKGIKNMFGLFEHFF